MTGFPSSQKPFRKAARVKKRPSPVSVRFSAEELTVLKEAASGQSLSAYIKARVLGKRPVAKAGCDPVLLGQILRALAANEFLAGLQELDWAEHNGQISLSPESQLALRDACVSVTQMRSDLMQALGLRKT